MILLHTGSTLSVCGEALAPVCSHGEPSIALWTHFKLKRITHQAKMGFSGHHVVQCSKCKQHHEALAACNRALDLARHHGDSIATLDDMQVTLVSS